MTSTASLLPITPARRLRGPAYHKLTNFFFFIFIVCGAIEVVDPSPYDFASLAAIAVWFCGGFKIHRSFVTFAALIGAYNLAGFISLIPYWNEPDPVMFMLQSFYLLITALFFAIFFGERTLERAELCLKAYAVSNIVAASAAIAGYLDIGGSSALFMNYDRAMGTFRDPNVLGSYVIMGALYCIQLLILQRTKHVLITSLALVVILAGTFLSFSRGSWGALVFSAALVIALGFLTSQSRQVRKNIIIWGIVTIVALGLILVALMSVESIRDLLLQRAQGVGDEYDDRRFMNQAQSLPMLLDRPFGFGPLRFRVFFGLEPHSSFVNAFASYGWLGGFAFLLLVGVTAFIGFRLCWVKSPYRTLAQVYWPSLLAFFAQGFQIDIDHWRHVFLMLGAVWGLEAARQRWVEAGSPESQPLPAIRAAPTATGVATRSDASAIAAR